MTFKLAADANDGLENILIYLNFKSIYFETQLILKNHRILIWFFEDFSKGTQFASYFWLPHHLK